MSFTRRRTAMLIAAGTLTACATMASAMTGLPMVQHQGSVEFVNGGIGAAESDAMRKAEADWPLSLVFAQSAKPRAEYLAEVKAVIRDAGGRTLLTVDQAGPILLAKLEPGDYAIDATVHGKTLHEMAHVKTGEPARVELLWP